METGLVISIPTRANNGYLHSRLCEVCKTKLCDNQGCADVESELSG